MSSTIHPSAHNVLAHAAEGLTERLVRLACERANDVNGTDGLQYPSSWSCCPKQLKLALGLPGAIPFTLLCLDSQADTGHGHRGPVHSVRGVLQPIASEG